jgi:hypothetical protein
MLIWYPDGTTAALAGGELTVIPLYLHLTHNIKQACAIVIVQYIIYKRGKSSLQQWKPNS